MVSTGRRGFLGMAAAAAGTSMLPAVIREALAVEANNVTGTLADVEHVVIFMQENRSFDHYFGTMSGVRGFDDPRAITLPSGKPVWYQPNTGGPDVLPFHFDVKNTSALSVGTNHSWKGSQQTWQGWDAWVRQKTALSMGYFDRADIPFYYALADAFTICDAYHCSIFGATDPNRMFMLTGTNQNWIASMGSLYNISQNGHYNNDPAKDNVSATVTASAPNWTTYAETLEANRISWKVYQEWDNYGDNYLAYFRNFRVNADGSRLSSNSALYQRGRAIAPGSNEGNSAGTRGDWLVNQFADDVRNGTLPAVSWICAPNDYTEHSPNSPNAGENLSARLLAALVANPAVWSKTVFLLTYDENDGFFDHMPAPVPPLTPAMGRTTLPDVGKYENYQGVPVGLGPRVPMLIVSPWTKGGRVCSQLFDHTSQLRFLEEWLVARGRARNSIACAQISPWRRAVCGDLTSAFDFKNPNTGWPASVPKQTTYTLVNGKPTPVPPQQQSLPRQERCSDSSNTRPACALPYRLGVDATANLTRLAVDLRNTGSSGAAFIAYSSVRSDGPWYYAVEAGKSIEAETWNFNTPSYELSIHGPNGFLRQFKGSTAAGTARPELRVAYDAALPGVVLYLSNMGGAASCTLTVSDNAYGAASSTVIVGPSATVALTRPLSASFGWYDFSIRSSSDGQFLRRIAGHVDTGAASRTDPMIGTNRTQQSALSARSGYVHRGMGFPLAYAAPAGKLDLKNWIGIYAAGSSPGNGSAVAWSYVPQQSGSWIADTTGLPVGDYNAWYLYRDGYEALGGPVPFCVTELITNTTASFARGEAAVLTFALPTSRVRARNWIGLWAAGSEPGTTKWLDWKYITSARGSASFETSKLAPGNYAAWMLFDDGYQLLGGPSPFRIV
ncbi:phosphocholine-specific phospholipase C [Massilia sp. CF038]|uniref:phosphocholine-specific phospholipase C n=1 Tax=Massilia sp. CF038 TaxID=1881045 RepID=UPI00091FBB25|nr:phospholipase C, phosphocholine-specific [Massilia sp. CF038]SHH57521.1 phospholipase C [Massilia sp. CF038]